MPATTWNIKPFIFIFQINFICLRMQDDTRCHLKYLHKSLRFINSCRNRDTGLSEKGLNKVDANNDIHFLLRIYLYNEVRKRNILMTINRSILHSLNCACSPQETCFKRENNQSPKWPDVAQAACYWTSMCQHLSVGTQRQNNRTAGNVGVLSRCKIRFVLNNTNTVLFFKREGYVAPS